MGKSTYRELKVDLLPCGYCERPMQKGDIVVDVGTALLFCGDICTERNRPIREEAEREGEEVIAAINRMADLVLSGELAPERVEQLRETAGRLRHKFAATLKNHLETRSSLGDADEAVELQRLIQGLLDEGAR